MYFLLEATEIRTGVPEYSSVDNFHLQEKAFFTLLLSPVPPLMGAALTSLEDIPTNAHLSGLEDVPHAPPFNTLLFLRTQQSMNLMILSQTCALYHLSKHPTFFAIIIY